MRFLRFCNTPTLSVFNTLGNTAGILTQFLASLPFSAVAGQWDAEGWSAKQYSSGSVRDSHPVPFYAAMPHRIPDVKLEAISVRCKYFNIFNS